MSTQETKRVVLAYSGGLDTSCILKWLIEDGFEVVCFLGDVGQPTGDVERLKTKALSIGAKSCHVINLQKEFVTDFIFPAFRANAIYESRYLLGTSIARPVLAKALVELAQQEGCQYLAHGATGKGNDQVRFELHAAFLDPSLTMIAPWRIPRFFERFPGRQHLLAYAAEKGIEVDQTPKKSYSMDENLLHISYESGVLEDPAHSADTIDFKMTVSPLEAPDAPEMLKIEFVKGDPVKVTNLDTEETVEDPLELFLYLNKIAGKHGVGRVDIVENRFVGIKSRGVYETPGGTILHMARMDLETLVLDKGVQRVRDSLREQYANKLYNGFWYSPEFELLQSVMDKTADAVDGSVTLQLYKGNVIIKGRESERSLYNESLASMDEAGGYDPIDAEGFIHIHAVRLRSAAALRKALAK